ncbi:MAG: DUF1449 family protein [Candidatus Poribacteria bacterium]|nr:DUF1449 family protein [Candidatus Poribacteria bacterium]
MGGFFDYIFAWYNVWFTAPIAFVFLFAILQLVMGGLDFGSGDVDVDTDVDMDVDADVDVDADAEVDAESSSGGGGFVSSVLGILNVGKVPFTIILMALFSIWGISGLIVNDFLNIDPNSPRAVLWIPFAAAFLCSIFGTRYLALGISKLFPESERATTNYDLIGLTGRVISGRVTTTFGTARVQVPDGPELTVSCRIREGEEIPLKGDTVILIDYDPTTRIFDVTKADSSFDA